MIKNILNKKGSIKEFFKFAIVGGMGTVWTILILYLLTEFAGIYYIMSATLAFLFAMTHNFVLNKIWTFKEKIRANIKSKYIKFAIVSVVALGVNLSFLYIFTEFLGIYYLISQVLAIGVALIINFLGSKIWAFSK